MKKILGIVGIIYAAIVCLGYGINSDKWKKHIPPSMQRIGDAEKGLHYLQNGNYVSSGIPAEFYNSINSGLLPATFTKTKHRNGTEIIAPNCFTCHSDYLNGELILGLGNHSFDYTQNLAAPIGMMSMMVGNRYGKDSKEWEAYHDFKKASMVINPNILTETRGVNPADKLTSALVAHRHPEDLSWNDTAMLKIPEITIPTDVPPWWVLKKKNAMFYTAIGRGDFSKFLMASSLLTLRDTTEAQEIDSHFPDVFAWINSLKAPNYPKPIDKTRAAQGEVIFNKTCSKCHGTYGEKDEYPNLLISLDKIGTDPALSQAYTDGTYQDFIDWYDKSWFVKGKHAGKLVVEGGYVAQPLDGIWASAPYFHNGSVPDLESVLNSKIRPSYWTRTFDDTDYNFESLGWNYVEQDSKIDNKTYDTTLLGYGNQGHLFGDKLSQEERMAVIEYLKTL